MDGLYYKAIGVILLFPWSLVAVTLAGYLRGRLARRAS